MPSNDQLIQSALDQGQGILRLAPNWVPRSFCIPGRRIKHHPDAYLDVCYEPLKLGSF